MLELDMNSSATIRASVSTVYINDILEPRLRCASLESAVGPVPGTAILMLGSIVDTEASPRTLLSTDDYARWKYGSRVKIMADGDLAFLGTMLQRNDSGAQDNPIFIAMDDRWLLSKLNIRGCMVYDSTVPGVKFLSRYIPEFNPGGLWNCVGVDVGAPFGVTPIFFPYAQARPSDSISDVFTGLVEGEITCWTPRRAIKYLQFISTVDDSKFGYNKNRAGFRTFSDATRIKWLMNLDGLDGTAGKGGLDPLDAKLQSINLVGRNALESICNVLAKAGTHDLGLDINEDVSNVMFFPRNGAESGLVINVRRGGQVTEANTAVDFDLFEDASNVSESVLIEGQERKLELRVEFDPTKGSDYNDDQALDLVNTLKPSWDDLDEFYFLTCVQGNGTYAYLPPTPGTIPSVVQNGVAGKSLIEAMKPEAYAAARALYPDVFMTYQINVKNLSTMTPSPLFGLSEQWRDEENFPINYDVRMVYHEQLSKLFINNSTMMNRVPIRCQIMAYTGDSEQAWVECPYLNGLLTSPTKVRLQGIAENADGQLYCSYDGSLATDPLSVTRRGVRLNISIPLDHRVEGYVETLETDVSQMDPSLSTEFNGKLMEYDLNPAYVFEYNMHSYPQPNQTSAITNAGFENDEINIGAAAERLLQRRKNPEKRSNWVFPGIRLDYQPGKWVEKIKVLGGNNEDIDYKVEAIIPSVVHDFLRQETRVGGIHSYTPSPNALPENTVAKVERPEAARTAKEVKEDRANAKWTEGGVAIPPVNTPEPVTP